MKRLTRDLEQRPPSRREYRWSTSGDVRAFQPGGKTSFSSSGTLARFTRMPIPQTERLERRSAHPRRSIFSSHVEVSLALGTTEDSTPLLLLAGAKRRLDLAKPLGPGDIAAKASPRAGSTNNLSV